MFQKSPDFLMLEDCFHQECSEILSLPRGAIQIQMTPRLYGGIGRIVQHDFFLQQFLIGASGQERKTSKHSILNLLVHFFSFSQSIISVLLVLCLK